MWYWHKNRHVDTWHRMDVPYIFGQLILKRVPRSFNGERTVSSTNVMETTEFPRATFGTVYTYTKNNSKWINGLDIRAKAIDLRRKQKGKFF